MRELARNEILEYPFVKSNQLDVACVALTAGNHCKFRWRSNGDFELETGVLRQLDCGGRRAFRFETPWIVCTRHNTCDRDTRLRFLVGKVIGRSIQICVITLRPRIRWECGRQWDDWRGCSCPELEVARSIGRRQMARPVLKQFQVECRECQ